MKTKWIRSAIPIYIAAAVWVVYGLVGPLYKLQHILMAAGLSIAAFLIAGKFFPGRRVETILDISTGDPEADKALKACQEDLKKLREANAGISSEAVSRKLDHLEKTGGQIIGAVAEKPSRAGQVRKFMTYYLPTTTKLLEQYRTMTAVDNRGEHVTRAMTSVENSLDLIAQAFDKQLDNLYKDDAMDMTTDVSVLETMMNSDGLTDAGIEQAMKEDKEKCQTM